MPHPTKTLLCLGLLGLVSAQSSVVSLFIPDTDQQPLVASIMGNDATATTYSITCPSTFHECGMGPGILYTGGPKTAAWSVSMPGFAGAYDCSVGGTTTAVCKTFASGSQANFPGVKTVTQSNVPLLPVTITAGSVTSVTGAPATQASATGAGTAPAATAGQTSGAESTGTASQAGSGSSKAASTGGLPAVTGNVGVVGAVAVAVAAAVL